MIPATTLPDGTTLLGTPLADANDPDAPVGGIEPTRIGSPLADAAADPS